jgi:hypothetical protein
LEHVEREVRIIKSDSKKRYTLGVVYEPDVVDSQGDWTDAEEIEKAAHAFMLALQGRPRVNKAALDVLALVAKGLRERPVVAIDVSDCWEELRKAGEGLGYMHEAWDPGIGEIVECYVAPCDMTVNGQLVRKGTWLLGVVWSEEYFAKVEADEIAGFSMGGTGRRIADAQAG